MKRTFLLFFIGCCWTAFSQESFTLSPESILTIAGTSTVHDWEVTANSIEGSLDHTDYIIANLKIEVQVAKIKSERGTTMDNKMHAALKNEEHPKIYFSADELKANGRLAGRLSIAGVKKEIDVIVGLNQEDEKIMIFGTQEIVFKDYGMEPPTAMFGQIVVGDSVTIKFNLIFFKG